MCFNYWGNATKKAKPVKFHVFTGQLGRDSLFYGAFDLFLRSQPVSIAGMSNRSVPSPELLAPAGDSEAAYAALQFGAAAIYTGLPRFSARADATNLSLTELGQVVAYAHALQPRRRVYVTLNTLLQERDLPEAVQALAALDEIGVDAVIVQDLGVYRIAHRAFPRLRLHASTQLAVHDLAGVRALAALGFRRVVLARELSLEEVADISRQAEIETEVFVHGALCYSYSGLCLFSTHQTGRSGNRGRCAYCCREPFAPANGGARPGFPFSMRDLALAPSLPALTNAGVASLKIEGRMKNALYVACVTDYYRHKLDGQLTAAQDAELVQDLQTVFSRPWTQLYAEGRSAMAGSIIDAIAVGHRGAPIGEMQAVLCDTLDGSRWLRFHTRRPLEKHDGLQIELPSGGKPYGFPVDAMRLTGSARLEITVPANTTVEVRLPPDDVPEIPMRATVFCSASQAVRRRYQFSHPRASACRLAQPVDIRITLRPEGFSLQATTAGADTVPPLSATVTIPLPLSAARQPDRTAAAVQHALERSGDTPWQMAHLTLDDPQGLFAPASALNDARRALFDALTDQAETQRQTRCAAVQRTFAIGAIRPHDTAAAPGSTVQWTAKFNLDAPVQALPQAAEIILNLGHLAPADARTRLHAWLAKVPRQRLRLALPLITRQHDAAVLQATLTALLADGWTTWECADLGGFHTLRDCADDATLDLTADWTPYGLNHLAREQLADLGVTRTVASPEDTQSNIVALAAAPGPAVEVLVWQQTPLFISETAPVSAHATPADAPRVFANRRGSHVITHQIDGRWITVAKHPFCLADHQAGLERAGIRWFRADFAWSPPGTPALPRCWDDLLSGHAPAASHTGNFLRGLA